MSELVEQLTSYGAFGVIAAIFFVLFWRERKENNIHAGQYLQALTTATEAKRDVAESVNEVARAVDIVSEKVETSENNIKIAVDRASHGLQKLEKRLALKQAHEDGQREATGRYHLRKGKLYDEP